MKKIYSEIVQSLADLALPRNCLACRTFSAPSEKDICTSCLLNLSYTDHFEQQNNSLYSQINLFTPLHHAGALFYFQKEGVLAKLIHQMKYKKQRHIGEFLGKWLGHALLQSSYFGPISGLIPVPLHPQRQQERGYNQAEVIAQAMGITLQKPVHTQWVRRAIYTPPLALANQNNRWKIIQNAFELGILLPEQHGHFVLVDDVITTGATLNACARVLLSHAKIKLSIAVVGYRF
ncbi:MAG: ComF family protein [Flavobacteriaceae bacterium]